MAEVHLAPSLPGIGDGVSGITLLEIEQQYTAWVDISISPVTASTDRPQLEAVANLASYIGNVH